MRMREAGRWMRKRTPRLLCWVSYLGVREESREKREKRERGRGRVKKRLGLEGLTG